MGDGLEVHPSVASSWTISKDGLLYTFYIREDVFFHDNENFKEGKGRRVVASDFVYSFDRLLSEDLAAPGSWVFNNVSSYSAKNDTTLQFI